MRYTCTDICFRPIGQVQNGYNKLHAQPQLGHQVHFSTAKTSIVFILHRVILQSRGTSKAVVDLCTAEPVLACA